MREQIKDEILKWLLEEKDQGWKIGQNDKDPYYYYTYRILDEQKTIVCTICIEPEIDRVMIMNEIEFTERDGLDYKLSSDKGRYWIDLRVSLMNLGLNFTAIPNVENLEKLQVHKLIYFDAWSRDRFMNAIFTIMDATELADILFKKFAMDKKDKLKKG